MHPQQMQQMRPPQMMPPQMQQPQMRAPQMQQPMMQPQHMQQPMMPGNIPHPQFPQGQPQQMSPTGQNPGLPRLTKDAVNNPFSAPLPDGVKLVPIDENTMKNIGSIGLPPPGEDTQPKTPETIIPEIAPTQEPTRVSAQIGEAFSAKTPSSSEALASFIQNERNGAIFYKNLSKRAPSKEYRSYLSRIIENCNTRREKLGKAYQQLRGEEMTPANSDIERPIAFTKGLRSAIIQETSAVQELGRLYELTTDQSMTKLINSQIHSKTNDIALLNMMMSYSNP
ncbi:MAG: hypothetical protein FWE20_10655 [Defluviitaleaceae bacterium]|nr:hypothetical protein [Defluviitaleaceae bacterium]